MKLPNKIINYHDSIIPNLILIMENLNNDGHDVQMLYDAVKNKISSVNEYIDALDILYVLNKIELKEDGMVYAI